MSTQSMFNKPPAPNSQLVMRYFKEHPNEYLEIHCGMRAYRQTQLDVNQIKKFAGKPSLFLPHYYDFRQLWWPVQHLTIHLLWGYSDIYRQAEFAKYLTHVCKAESVLTVLDGVVTNFMDI